MRKKVGRIRDVAKETGLSIATISRVMNGVPTVRAATRDRVLQACARLDYVPNPAARALSTNKSRTVAAIIPTIENSVFAKFVAAVERTLAVRDYSLVLAVSNSDPEEELRAARKLLGMGADAFILSGADHSPALLHMMDRRAVPTVFTSIWDPACETPTIGYDNFGLAAKAVRYLADLGHSDVAVIHGPLAESDRTQARRAGAASVSSRDLRLRYYETALSTQGAKHAVAAILSGARPASAILCTSDVLAIGTYFGLAAAGLRIPQDMSVMGFDNLDWSKDAVPALTTIDLPADTMGQEVASQIVAHLDSDAALEPRLLPGRIIERQSVRTIGAPAPG